MNIFLIFMGAGTGGVLRYLISNGVYLFLSKQFPYGTLIVNITGCLLMGILYVLTLEKMGNSSAQLRALLLVGFLGGYTTFSSFSIETINLIENGAWLSAFLNILLSVVICLLAAWFGVSIGRNL